MKKFVLILSVLVMALISTACINNLAVQELNNKAKGFMDKGDYESAISRLEASVDLDSSIFETQYNLAVAYTYANKYKEAISAFNKAIELKPDMPETYYSLAVAQENYAIDLIKGEVALNNNLDVENSSDDDLELSKEELNSIKELYNQAILSYETYLQKANNPKDKDRVEAKIENIKVEIKKLDNPDYNPEEENKSFSVR